MAATDEELEATHNAGMDHVTYILIFFRFAHSPFFAWADLLICITPPNPALRLSPTRSLYGFSPCTPRRAGTRPAQVGRKAGRSSCRRQRRSGTRGCQPLRDQIWRRIVVGGMLLEKMMTSLRKGDACVLFVVCLSVIDVCSLWLCDICLTLLGVVFPQNRPIDQI
jgi:hypothetical protein